LNYYATLRLVCQRPTHQGRWPWLDYGRTFGAKKIMPIVRKREIENLEQLSGEELQAFIDTLPAQQDTISDLLDFIEDELYDTECNHSLQLAMRFMMENNLNFPKITSWLNENGGYCDCKVMEQIAPIWRAKFGDD
jgi:hypothetical protein